MATISFDKTNKYIQLGVNDTSTNIQELVNAIRDYEDELDRLDIKKLMDATGKDDIGGGNKTGVTLKLLNSWKLRADTTFTTATIVRVSGGNLVTDDGTSPFVSVTNVSYDRALSTAPGLAGTIESDVTTIKTHVKDCRDIDFGRWKIQNNQLLFYNADGSTVLRTFNLKNSAGNPTSTSVMERVPV